VKLYLINTGNISLLTGAIVELALEIYVYLLIISPLLIGALMCALCTIILNIGIGLSVIILTKLFDIVVHY
jgi:hypothetical protein